MFFIESCFQTNYIMLRYSLDQLVSTWYQLVILTSVNNETFTWYSTQLWRMRRGDASRQREEPEDRWGLRPRRRRRVGEFRQVLEPELITRHGTAAPHIPEIEQQLDKLPALTFRDLTNLVSSLQSGCKRSTSNVSLCSVRRVNQPNYLVLESKTPK